MAFAFAGGGVAIIVAGLWMPYEQPAPYVVDKPTPVRMKQEQELRPTLQDFVSIWDRNLRPPLVDPPVETPSDTSADTKAVVVVRPDLRLIGYTVEADDALAILIGRRGTVEFKKVGEELDGVTVLSISSAGVLLSHNGQEYTLQLEEDPHAYSPAIEDGRRVDRSGYNTAEYN